MQRTAKQLVGLRVAVRLEAQRKPPGQAAEDAPACVARVAREYGADLLAVASKRSSGLAGLLLGSTAQALLRLSPCPVLVVRPADGAAQQEAAADTPNAAVPAA